MDLFNHLGMKVEGEDAVDFCEYDFRSLGTFFSFEVEHQRCLLENVNIFDDNPMNLLKIVSCSINTLYSLKDEELVHLKLIPNQLLS